jgi:hypothetical protein
VVLRFAIAAKITPNTIIHTACATSPVATATGRGIAPRPPATVWPRDANGPHQSPRRMPNPVSAPAVAAADRSPARMPTRNREDDTREKNLSLRSDSSDRRVELWDSSDFQSEFGVRQLSARGNNSIIGA